MQNKQIVIFFSIGIVILIGISCAAAIIIFNTESHEHIEFLLSSSNASVLDTSISENIHERTFLMLKPDTVQRALIGRIIDRLEKKGFKLVAIKFMWATTDLIQKHYESSIERDHFPKLLEFMISGPVVPMVWEGLNVVKITRQMIGHSDPMKSIPNTIRADYSICRLRSIIHGAETIEEANREIKLWFQENELVSWTPANSQYVYNI